MGTDVHAFIEHKQAKESPIYNWAASFSLTRNYMLFNLLGNGRNFHFPQAEWKERALIVPKGAPHDMSLVVARELYDLVIGSSNPQQSDYPNHWFWNKEQCVTHSLADKRFQESKAFWGEVRQTFNLNCNAPCAIWKALLKESLHSVSYLTYDEILITFEAYNIHVHQLPSDYLAMLNYFKTIIDSHEYDDVRLLFWFDN